MELFTVLHEDRQALQTSQIGRHQLTATDNNAVYTRVPSRSASKPDSTQRPFTGTMSPGLPMSVVPLLLLLLPLLLLVLLPDAPPVPAVAARSFLWPCSICTTDCALRPVPPALLSVAALSRLRAAAGAGGDVDDGPAACASAGDASAAPPLVVGPAPGASALDCCGAAEGPSAVLPTASIVAAAASCAASAGCCSVAATAGGGTCVSWS